MSPGAESPGAVLDRPARGLLELVSAEVAAVLADQAPGPVVPADADARFYDDLGFDSVMLMQLKYRIENRLPELGELSLSEMVGSLVSVTTLVEYLTDLAEEVRP
ncbi:acyl carrier protein [Kitasatospora sp. NPDC101801]|uniref:acyl carrier protein n=1 Tax=Kitasatospora sp. NPDC101801 TaxID=3364103 RepID=UPI0038069DB6